MDIYEGEFVSLVGPSGCGKSTFLRCIAGLEKSTEGEITHNGKSVVGPGADRGMAFEAYALFPLSGGMQQRWALARLFANDPLMMLMDEPLAAVGAQIRELLQEELLKLWTAVRKTVVFVTHSIDEVVLLSNRIAVMTKPPRRIKEIVLCDLPRPRTYKMRLSDEYFRILRRVGKLVREEIICGRASASPPAGREEVAISNVKRQHLTMR